jgi:hypothetical protein
MQLFKFTAKQNFAAAILTVLLCGLSASLHAGAVTSTSAPSPSHSVTLAWSPSGQPAGIDVPTWNVYRSASSSGPYGLIATVQAGTTTYVDSSVLGGNRYFYVVTAVSTQMESAYSSWVDAAIPADPVVTPAPTVAPSTGTTAPSTSTTGTSGTVTPPLTTTATAPATSTVTNTVSTTSTGAKSPVNAPAPVTISTQPVAQPSTSQLPAGLVLYWSFDSGDVTGGIAADQSGNNGAGTFNGTPVVVSGKLHEALSFNGVNAYVSMNAFADRLTAFYNSTTLSAWVKTTNASRGEAIFSKFSAADSGAGYILRTNARGTVELTLGGDDLASGGPALVDSTKINDGEWHHVAAVITLGQDVKFYVDGKLSSTIVSHTIPGGDGWSNLIVGVNPWNALGDYFTGSIDEARVYNRALSSAEIGTLFSWSAGAAPVSSAAPAAAASSTPLTTPSTNTTAPATTTVNSASSISSPTTSTNTNTSSASSPAPSVPAATTMPSGLVLYWSFDSGDVTGGIATDQSGNNGAGTFNGTPVVVSGKLHEALSFNGVNAYVSMNAFADRLTAFYNSTTLSAWVKTTNASRGEAIFSKFSAADSGAGYILRTNARGTLELTLGGDDLASGGPALVDSTKINDGEWHHVAAVITLGQDVKFYVDGKLSSTIVSHTVPGGDGWSNLIVGVNPWNALGDYFTGSIDEARVYNRALSSAEINTVYLLSGGSVQ